MTPNQVIKHFGSERVAAESLRMSRQIVNFWKKKRAIPRRTQAWIELQTGGALKAAAK